MLAVIEALAWPVTTLLIVFIAARVVSNIAGAGDVKSFGIKTKWAEIMLEMSKKKQARSLPEPGETVFTRADLKEALASIPQCDSSAFTDERLDYAFRFLRQTGVVTKKQLQELTASVEIREALAKIYVTDLRRSPDAPLDPLAIATWGAFLYLYGVNDENLEKVRGWIREFPEYRKVTLASRLRHFVGAIVQKPDFRYQSETFGTARSVLMAPHPKGEDRSFVGAFHECMLGLDHLDESALDEDARRDVAIVRRTIDTTGIQKEPGDDGLWIAKVRQMSESEKFDFSNAVNRLASWFDDAFNRAHPD